jgi:hypothetical protein
MPSTRDEQLLALLNAAEDELSTAKVIHNRQEQDAALQQVSELLTELRTALLNNNKPISNKENKYDN